MDGERRDPAEVYCKVIPGNIAAIASEETDEASEEVAAKQGK